MNEIQHPPPPAPGESWRPSFQKTRAGKLVFIGTLLVALLGPHWMIGTIIAEREAYQSQVREGIAASWGPPQTLLGPVLVVPTRTPVARAPDVTEPQRWEQGRMVILPSQLRAEVRLAPERRQRGLFEAVIYEAEVGLTASLAFPASTEDGPELLWRDAFVVTGARDLRSVGARLSLNGRDLTAHDASEAGCAGIELLRWDLSLEGAPEAAGSLVLNGALTLRGTGSFGLLPLARRTEMGIVAPWPTPSFTGRGLPVRSEVTEKGFSASWQEGMGQPLVRRLGADWCQQLVQRAAPVGVELLEAVPTYRMVTRASKYAVLFLSLAFLTYLLFELQAGVRIHLVQYGLLGLSIVLFPLLLLAFGEPLGFAAAYLISTAAVVGQASIYTAGVTRRAGLAGLFAGVLGGLLGFLYIVLSLEAYALLVGAVAIFIALSVVMMVTRRVDWSRS